MSLNVSAIVEAAHEQATGIKEINSAVASLDRGTQQNAAIAEQSTAASHSLANEAQALNQLLLQFKTSEAARAKLADAAPKLAEPDAKPVPSPARKIANKVSRAFTNGSGAATAAAVNEWDDF